MWEFNLSHIPNLLDTNDYIVCDYIVLYFMCYN